MIIVAIILALCGLGWLLYLLRRDRDMIWRPGDPLPEIPADAALRHWHSQASRLAGTRRS